MESIQVGIYKHDWLYVSKCVEGLAEEFKKIKGAYFIIWNVRRFGIFVLFNFIAESC